MGLCASSAGAATAPRKATALVLLPTGELREYPRPATAAQAIGDAAEGCGQEEGWFLCDADGMGFEGPVSAVGGEEALRAGQIYFVLPAAARRRGLRREEVAALAVKASAALARAAAASGASGRRRRGGAVAPFVFSPPTEEEEQQQQEKRCLAAAARSKTVPAPSSAGTRRQRPRHRRFASDLTAIPECEISG